MGEKQKKKQYGFTFIEILSAVLVTGLISVLLYQVFSLSLSMWNKYYYNIDLTSDARSTLELLSTDISGSFLDLDSAELCSMQGVSDELWFYSYVGLDYAKNPSRLETPLVKIGYYVGIDNGDTILFRSYEPNQFVPLDFYDLSIQPVGEETCSSLKNIQFRYWKGDFVDNDRNGIIDDEDGTDTREWADSWDADVLKRLPKMIFIEMTLTTSNGRIQKKYMTTATLF